MNGQGVFASAAYRSTDEVGGATIVFPETPIGP